MSLKNLMLFLLSASLVVGAVFTGGCASTQTQTIEDVSAQEAFTLIEDNQNNPDFIIIDVRTPQEFADGHVEKANNLDFNSETFRDDLNKLDKDKTYLIYCRSGNRSRNALNIMRELDFGKIYHMSGGIIEWAEEGLPTVK
ncbi:rhodanese-like domain-containing protein [Chloroflexota bacterium]